jgi:hypothetical protein
MVLNSKKRLCNKRLGYFLVITVYRRNIALSLKEIIKCKISELQDEFNSRATYPEKNQMLIQLRQFYNTIHDNT